MWGDDLPGRKESGKSVAITETSTTREPPPIRRKEESTQAPGGRDSGPRPRRVLGAPEGESAPGGWETLMGREAPKVSWEPGTRPRRGRNLGTYGRGSGQDSQPNLYKLSISDTHQLFTNHHPLVTQPAREGREKLTRGFLKIQF